MSIFIWGFEAAKSVIIIEVQQKRSFLLTFYSGRSYYAAIFGGARIPDHHGKGAQSAWNSRGLSDRDCAMQSQALATAASREGERPGLTSSGIDSIWAARILISIPV